MAHREAEAQSFSEVLTQNKVSGILVDIFINIHIDKEHFLKETLYLDFVK